MAWRSKREGKQLLTFTDGYIRDIPERMEHLQTNQQPYEQRMANNLARLTTRTNIAPQVRKQTEEYSPISADVWVLGDDQWHANPPSLFKPLLEDVNNSNYRAILTVLKLNTPDQIYASDFSSYLRSSGMTRKHRHKNNQILDTLSQTLFSTYLTDQSSTDHFNDMLEQYRIPSSHAHSVVTNRDG